MKFRIWIQKALAIALCLFGAALIAQAQSVTAIEDYGVVNSQQLYKGVGFNLTPTNEWEYNMAKQAGAVEGRFQCDWRSVEIQTSSNTSGGYTLPSSCASGLTFSKKYSLQPLVIAAYGAPYHNIVTLHVTTTTTAGPTVYTIPVTAVTGSLSSINVPYCEVIEGSTQITGKHAYGGSLIASVNTTAGTITLASALTSTLTAGAVLTVNQLLYPAVATTSTTDPSNAAYAGLVNTTDGGYVGFLADSINAQALTGRVEIWNEPPWANDPWDGRYKFYDTVPGGLSTPTAIQPGFVGILETQTPPGNVRYNWAGPQKSGYNSLLGPRISPSPTPTQLQTENSFTSESFHPYTNNPEDAAWNQTCLNTATTSTWVSCNLTGTDSANNMKLAVLYNQKNFATNGWKIEQNVTETGLPTTTNQTAKARFVMRQYLILQALGITRINFYRLADAGANYGFVDSNTQTAQLAYTAVQRMTNDMSLIPGTYAGTPALPSVVSGTYLGYYPLAVMKVKGIQTGDTLPSILFICWQRSYASSGWETQASPAAVNVQINIPAGYTIGNATDMITRAGVKKTVVGSVLTIPVADDPIEVKLTPTP